MRYITETRTTVIVHAVPISSSATWEDAVKHVEEGDSLGYTNGDCIEREYEDTDADMFVGVMYRGKQVDA